MTRPNLVVALSALSLPALLAFTAAHAGEPAKPAPAPAAAPAQAAAACAPEAAPAKAEDHAAHAAASTDREHVDADGVVRRGAKLSKGGELVTVSAAVKRGKELDGKKIKLQGKVSDVCTKMGCWFVVQGDKPEDKIRISTKSHSIFVPMKAVGYHATVEGTLTVRTITKEVAQHYEDERTLKAGEAKKTITGDQTEIFIDVAGLEMKKG
ncbi:MAG: hypothetical protein A2138_12795 [Deltaproteobacteria bacterium RBG_16_71_12]|nr:MAG: hypothetical protein A2138_12795 [Deltaproteobacteria bacterium RBG_16_71_12]